MALVTGHAWRLFLKIDIGERVAVVILDDEAGVVGLIDGPQWREAASGRHGLR